MPLLEQFKTPEIVWGKANLAVFWLDFVLLMVTIVTDSVRMDVRRRFLFHRREFEKLSKLSFTT